MTTSVKIKHEGPEHHSVVVRVLEGEQVTHEYKVRPGKEAPLIYVYRGRVIEISEALISDADEAKAALLCNGVFPDEIDEDPEHE